jgi:drug/metabolite transporter (DMT)-like permease
MTLLATLLLIANLVTSATGQLALKGASARAAALEGAAHWRALMLDWVLWLAVAAFILELVIWLAFVSLVPLSLGVLVGCSNIVGVMIGARLVFGERFTGPRLAAAALILLGVALVGWGA